MRDTLLVQRPVHRGWTQITEVIGMILPVDDGTRRFMNKEEEGGGTERWRQRYVTKAVNATEWE